VAALDRRKVPPQRTIIEVTDGSCSDFDVLITLEGAEGRPVEPNQQARRFCPRGKQAEGQNQQP
jgi:hypothetical protein